MLVCCCNGCNAQKMTTSQHHPMFFGSDVNYEPLAELVHQTVATHALHQQRCENYVQMAALTASTNVGEGRRTHRSNALSRIMRGFNHESSHDISKTRGKKVNRVEGSNRVRMFAKHINSFHTEVCRKGACFSWNRNTHKAPETH